MIIAGAGALNTANGALVVHCFESFSSLWLRPVGILNGSSR